ncbi:polyprenyl glycosylphosphotransferase [Sinomonas cyclohexanicum]|uniref:Polyprenyl glycosylphosphotransferase n=1 Tax=Sinomonas cyclohexanicum TaxID=322009 RepID=A0ABN6FHC4_SINCY|nr:sugar transferase [Corynebacterium cyclohexanicum]BCT75462.1 polyprenyl glycosylphosphotransferase [Corynebacterium cyclohexanicum]
MSVGAQQHPAHGSALPGARHWHMARRRSTARIARSPRAQGWPRRYAAYLRIADAVVVLAVVAVSVAAIDRSARAAVPIAVLACAWPFALGVYGSREHSVLGIGAEEYRRVVAATVQLFAAVAIAVVILDGSLPARVFVAVFAGGLPALLLMRWASRRWLSRQRQDGLYLTPTIVVGEAEDVRYVVRRIAGSAGAPYDVLGAVLPGGRRGQALTVDGERLPVLCSTDDVVRTVALKKAAAVIIAGPVPGGNQYLRELGWNLEAHDAELVLASSLTNVAGPRIHWRPVQGLPLMEVDLPHYSGARHVVKRAMDVALGTAAIVVLAPVLAALALVVRLDSPGPVLFRQERIGKGGQPFAMLKFRSMVQDAESQRASLATANEGSGVLFKIKDDPRITRCGHWMRRFSLDELPQFINVVRGDMSLVGPRPPLASEVGEYERYTRRRMLIKPGITGLWQISGRSDLPWDDAVRLDLYYVENWSLTGDLMILWRTFRAVLSSSGAY